MKTIIFDFDHTLFDTRTFKQEVDSIIDNHGAPQDIAVKAEKEFRNKNHNNYDFKGHIEHIKNLGIDIPDSIHDHFDALDLEKYHKGKVLKVVTELQNKGYRTILLTKGTDGFQDKKITGAGFKELFGKDIIVCSHSKEEVLKTLNLDEKNTYFFNDDTLEMERIYTNFPSATFIVCRRSDDKFDYSKMNPNFKLVENIDQISEIIK
ncbi:MAG: HAD family hydrolase [Patescibacteria group bacterium]